MNWNEQDYADGLCDSQFIGKPKEITEVIEVPDLAHMSDTEIASFSVRTLRKAAIGVFHQLGAEKWLMDLARSDPNAYMKMLQKLMPQSIEANVTLTSFEIPQAIRSLSLADLRAMRSQPEVIEAEYVEVKE